MKVSIPLLITSHFYAHRIFSLTLSATIQQRQLLMLMVPSRDDILVIPTPPSFAVASGTVDDDPSNSAIHLRRAQFIESPSKRRAISSTTSAHHDPSIDRLTSSFTSSPQATTDDSPSVHRGCPSPFAPVELYPPQHNAEGSSPNNQIRDGTESTTTTTNQSTDICHR